MNVSPAYTMDPLDETAACLKSAVSPAVMISNPSITNCHMILDAEYEPINANTMNTICNTMRKNRVRRNAVRKGRFIRHTPIKPNILPTMVITFTTTQKVSSWRLHWVRAMILNTSSRMHAMPTQTRLVVI